VDFGPHLFVAPGNGPIQPVGVAPQQITYTVNGQSFPRWVFNNVPVQPTQQYNFLADVSTDLKTASRYSTIWTHSPDARTYLPHPHPPPPCI
jgi:hypothetical protein